MQASVAADSAHSSKHNLIASYRADLENVDGSRTQLNEVLIAKDLRSVYTREFGRAVEAYNAKQKRKDRRIEDYYDHISKSKQEKLCYELIVQIGDRDNNPAVDDTCRERSAEVYRDYLERFREKYGHVLRVFEAVIHNDEATPHMHLAFVPVVENHGKNGLAVKNSFRQAMKELGIENGRAVGFYHGSHELLAEVMRDHGIEKTASRYDRAGRGDMTQEEYVEFSQNQEKLIESREKLAAAKDELASVMHETNAARRERGELQRGNNVLKDKQRQVAGDVRELQHERSELRGQVKAAIIELATAEHKATEAQNRADSWTVAAGVMEERVREYTIKADDAEQKAAEARQSVEKAQGEVDALKAEKNGLEVEKKALTHDLAEMRLHYSAEMSEMHRQRDEASQELERVQAQVSEAGKDLEYYETMRANVDEVAIETKSILGYVGLKADDFALLKEQAAMYRANRDEVLNLRERQWNCDSWERSLDSREVAVERREAAVGEREREAQELYESQVSINETLEETRADLSWARSDLKQAQAKIAAVEQERDGLRAELEKARETIGALKEKLTTAWTVCANIVKAARMLKYDKEEGFAVPDLPARAGKLLDSLASYAAGWLRREQHSDLAESVEERIGLSPGIQKEVDPPQQQKAKSHSRGAR